MSPCAAPKAGQAATKSYRYQPLVSNEATRIARLRQGQFDSPIQVDLYQAQLFYDTLRRPSSDRRYDALSYEWGTEERNATITCGGGTMHITPNLEDALRHLRREHDDINIWADLICIDHENDEERSAQVLLMGQIYRSALRTWIWLGPSIANTALGLKFIYEAGTLEGLGFAGLGAPAVRNVSAYQLATPTASGISNLIERRIPFDSDRVVFEKLCHKLNVNSFDHEAVEKVKRSVLNLITRPYFRRLWIIQEIALSHNAIILCGSHQISWSQFSSGALSRSLLRELGNSAYGSLELQQIHSIWRLAESGSSLDSRGHKSNLFKVLATLACGLCRDPRDKIYALLSLAPDAYQGITPDYKKSVESVYQETSAYLINQRQDLLLFRGMCPPSWRVSKTLPSWVRDWRSDSDGWQQNPDRAFRPPDGVTVWTASWLYPMLLPHLSTPIFTGLARAAGRVLRVQGLAIGVVHHVIPLWPSDQNVDDATLLDFLRRVKPCLPLEEEYNQTKPQDGFSARAESVLRTLLMYSSYSWLDDMDIRNAYLRLHLLFKDALSPMSPLSAHHLETKVQVRVDTEANKSIFGIISLTAFQRSFFCTDTGYFGMACCTTEVGDMVCTLGGAYTPTILRATGQCAHELIDQAFVLGAMDYNDTVYMHEFGQQHWRNYEIV